MKPESASKEGTTPTTMARTPKLACPKIGISTLSLATATKKVSHLRTPATATRSPPPGALPDIRYSRKNPEQASLKRH